MNLLPKNMNPGKFYVLTDQVVVSGSGFATNLLLAKALGLQEYGRFAAVGLVQLFLLSLSMGFSSQVYQVVYPGLSDSHRKTYTAGVLFQQLLMMLLLLLGGGVFYVSGSGLAAGYRDLIPLATIATCLYLLQDFLRKALLTQQKEKKAMWIDITTNGLQLLLLTAGWISGWLNIITALLIIGSTFLPSVLMGMRWLGSGRLNREALRVSLLLHKGKSVWLITSSLLQWTTGYFFVLSAGWWISAAALGALRLAQYIFGLLNVFLQAIENYCLPKAAVITDKPAYFKYLLKQCLLFMLPALFFLSLFAKPLLTMAGGGNSGSYSFLMYGLSLIYLVIALGFPVRVALRSAHLNRQYFTGYVLAALFTLSSAPLLLRQWQLYGVLTGLLVTQVITIGYWYFILIHKNILIWKSST